MVTRRLLVTSFGIALLLCLGSQAWAAKLFTARVTLDRSYAVSLAPGNAVTGRAVFGQRFIDIEQVCFSFEFTGDLLDPSDSLQIDLRTSPQYTSGFENVGGTAQSNRTLCLVKGTQAQAIALFKDGQQAFELSMVSGTVSISKLAVTLTGTVVAPTHVGSLAHTGTTWLDLTEVALILLTIGCATRFIAGVWQT